MGQGRGGRVAQTTGRGGGDATMGGGDAASVGASVIASGGTQTNSAGDSHCYHCGGEGHWANECPELAEEQLSCFLPFTLYPFWTGVRVKGNPYPVIYW